MKKVMNFLFRWLLFTALIAFIFGGAVSGLYGGWMVINFVLGVFETSGALVGWIVTIIVISAFGGVILAIVGD